MKLILRLLRAVNAGFEAVTAVTSSAIAAVMVLALTFSAVTRYVSGTGYDWFIELPPALVPWLVFPLLGPLLRSGAHIQVDLVPNFLHGRGLLLLQLFVYAVMLVGAIIFFLAGNEAVALFRRLGQLMELEIELPIWWMYLAFPTGFFILALFALELLLETIVRLFAPAQEVAA
ncbi:TRAP transporter small permease subunit [Alisedimentitalea sp. MJ-SS2]|uniref:TRAP transporter small permease n=1 Tax=Aliisedimentitalea sp. MJ-SS2 TaxID=3049795 RepID=UPI0029063DB2|nr:TRAP transporter small permease subunit [Alisedimentitalea sp. MJ-SS2]MDU8925917.1 TRAP transporter small permease subunit [Alisedimentitalea sp. MJ-SS2]